MRRAAGRVVVLAVLCAAGCAKGGGGLKLAQLSGQVTFKGQPVPAGYISFQSDAGGPVKVAQIKDGHYDTAQERDPGVVPGSVKIRIAGYDGKKVPYYPQGKQIFNPFELRETITEGATTKDFDVPASAANNLKIEPTADVP